MSEEQNDVQQPSPTAQPPQQPVPTTPPTAQPAAPQPQQGSAQPTNTLAQTQTTPPVTQPAPPKPAQPQAQPALPKPVPPQETEEQKAFRVAADQFESQYWKGHIPIAKVERLERVIYVTLAKPLKKQEMASYGLPQEYNGYRVLYEEGTKKTSKRKFVAIAAVVLVLLGAAVLYLTSS